MKQNLLFLFMFFTLINFVSADEIDFEQESFFFTLEKENIKSVTIVEKYESSIIVQIESNDGVVFWNVMAGIATQFIPDIAEGICEYVTDDDETCDVVGNVSDALVSLGGYNIYKKVTYGFRWIAKRLGRSQVSVASVEAKDYAKISSFCEIQF